jgi:hypothetical protein
MGDSTSQSDSSNGTAPAPVQLYRFKVKTADGREMTSAVAVVDPNSTDANQADPKDSLDALDQTHKAEAEQHGAEVDKAHADEKKEAESALDAHHADIAKDKLGALDVTHEAEALKTEAAADAKHVEDTAKTTAETAEKHDGEKQSLFGSLFDKAKSLVSSATKDLNINHLGDLAKQAETAAKGFGDKIVNQAEDFAKKHVAELNDSVGKLVTKGQDELKKLTGGLDKAFEGTHLQFLSDA